MGLLSVFSHSLAVFTEAWFKVHCSKADPKDCDGRGENLHRKTEEAGYRLVMGQLGALRTLSKTISNVMPKR